MSRINEIEEAVLQLTPAELDAFRTWFAEFDAKARDRQMQEDVAAGRLDGVVQLRASSWDYMAGTALVASAGGAESFISLYTSASSDRRERGMIAERRGPAQTAGGLAGGRAFV